MQTITSLSSPGNSAQSSPVQRHRHFDGDRSDWWMAVVTRVCSGGVLGISLSGFVAVQSLTRDAIAVVVGAAIVLWCARRNGSI
ncbi:hypothetical protein [Mitsuaria sp. GD03876]|uniref:hypothetical protein n=1 Tax=Mitsuaria sp. GD03876 TaxID=2975399 RepID=UPI002449C052|nr:hypothetical protein [Mitsuaria sp. GD03876]MDH0867954.1 hypothetical protein [Mitsuaria sp. GD03876]